MKTISLSFLEQDWGNLSWTSWCQFTDDRTFRQLPVHAGLYRVRAVGGQELFYIGETGRNLRARMGDLRRNTMKEMMPYNDPHTAAPSLWAWRHAEGLEFECSAAHFVPHDEKEEARRIREGLEFYLLWQYRLELGASTRCNHGRFHPRYKKSTDRKRGFQGHRIADDALDVIASGPSMPPLHLIATPLEAHWMGLAWSEWQPLKDDHIRSVVIMPGVYKLMSERRNEVIYIGESSNVCQRLSSHAKKGWEGDDIFFSYALLPDATRAYQRHEIENDLVAGFYAQRKRTPLYQLANQQ